MEGFFRPIFLNSAFGIPRPPIDFRQFPSDQKNKAAHLLLPMDRGPEDSLNNPCNGLLFVLFADAVIDPPSLKAGNAVVLVVEIMLNHLQKARKKGVRKMELDGGGIQHFDERFGRHVLILNDLQ